MYVWRPTRIPASRTNAFSNLAADLNFAELQPDSFDFILCHGILHHLINLEFILAQINRALTRDGIVLIYELRGRRQVAVFPKRGWNCWGGAFPVYVFPRRAGQA